MQSRGSSRTASRVAPADAPAAVRAAIAAGNQLIGKPYVYGGGHASFISAGYDCSARSPTRSTAAACSPRRSTRRRSRAGAPAGPGSWITVYTNPQHAYMEIAGIRLDTSALGDPDGQSGPRWRPADFAARAGLPARAASAPGC